MIDCFCKLLKHVDVTLFATQQQLLAAAAQLSNQISGDTNERALRLTTLRSKQSMVSAKVQSDNAEQDKTMENLVIN